MRAWMVFLFARTHKLKIFFLFFILVGFGLRQSCSAESSKLPIEVRLGVVVYEDMRSKFPYFTKIAEEMLNNPSQPFQIRYALGTYEEVLHWADEGLIDIAAVGPGVFVEMENLGLATGAANSKYRLIAKELSPPQPSKCFVSNNSPIKSYQDLLAISKVSKLKLIAPHPLSASGFMIPVDFLARQGINLAPSQVSFTYSHSNTLRMLASHQDPLLLACVWGGSTSNSEGDKIRSLDIPELEKTSIPDNVLLVRNDYAWGDIAVKSLVETKPKHFALISSASEDFEKLRKIRLDHAKQFPSTNQKSLPIEDIVSSLTQYATTQPQPPRLAVVLSGGGAKCAYQLGAVRALENVLAAARERLGIKDLDINLVIGTSGGAVNALPVAMGMTKTDSGYQAIREAWKDMDQREMLRPPRSVRIFLGLWLGAAQILLYLNIRRLLTRRARKRVGGMFLFFGSMQLLVGFIPHRPWALLGTSSAIHHFWLWISFGLSYAGLLLVTVGGLTMLSKRIRHMVCVSGSIRRYLVAFIILFPFIEAYLVLIHEQTFTDGKGLEAVLVRNYEKILTSNQKPVSKDHGGPDLETLSKDLIDSGLIKRDFVLTASPLANGTSNLQPDLYFYLPTIGSKVLPHYENKGVSFIGRETDLLSVLLGSSAIYPVFPSRRIENLPLPGSSLELVDGSFAHRSPVESAVLWGATHIVVIEASPLEVPTASGFAGNLANALNLLYEQAQLTDLRAHGIIPIYTLYPKAPHIGLLDFADNLIDPSIDKGYLEASDSGKEGSFIKELGAPIWWDPLRKQT